MQRRMTRTLIAMAVTASFLLPTAVLAADAPKWVAALYIGAQKSIGLRWMPIPGATGYKVLRSTTAGSGYAEIASPAQPQHFDTDIKPGESYYYVLQSLTGGEASPNSAEKSVSVPGEKKKEVMAPPTWKQASLQQSTEFGKTVSKVGLIWSPGGGGKAIAFNLYRSTVSGKDYTMLSSTAETNFTDITAETGKTYYYVLSALDQTFTETTYSEERAVEVKAPVQKKRKKRKKKIKLMLRSSTVAFEIHDGAWGQLEQPTGVAVNSRGEIYISEGLHSKVYVFDPAGEFLFTFGEKGKGEGQINQPLDIAIDPEDRVYLTMYDARVEIFTEDGTAVKSLPAAELTPEGKHHYAGVDCGPDYWYLTDDKAQVLYVLEYDTNEIVSTFGEHGGEPGQFNAMKKLIFSKKEDALVVADTFNFRVQVFRENKVDVVFGTYGNSVTQFSRVLDVAEDEKGNILAIDFGNQTIQAFDYTGKFQYVIGNQDISAQLALTGATGMVSIGTRVYVCNKLSGRIAVIDLGDEVGKLVKKKKKKQ